MLGEELGSPKPSVMKLPITRRATWVLILLGACLLIPSIEQVHKFWGMPGIALYVVYMAVSLVLGYRYILPRALTKVTERQTLWLAGVTLVLLIAAFAVVYPIADAGIGGGRERGVGGGSDRDDALNLAATELLHGRYLYYPRTYLGNRISPLPGAVFLAAPFVLIGNSAYQNLFWLVVLFFALKLFLKDGRIALLSVWGILFLSPATLQQLITGGDLLSNVIYIMVFSLFLISVTSRQNSSGWIKVVAAILLGIGLSSRANFILVLPLVFSLMAQNIGWKEATQYGALTSLAFVAVTLPFYLWDPAGFTPLVGQSLKVTLLPVLPSSGIVIPFLGGLLTFALMWQRMGTDGLVFLRNCAIVQALLYAFLTILPMIQGRGLAFDLAGYGLNFLLFGAVAAWMYLLRQAPVETPKPMMQSLSP